MLSDATILEKLEGLADAFNRHDVDAVLSHFADDAVMELPRGRERWGSRFVGKDAVRSGVAGRFEGLPDVHYANVEHSVVGRLGVSRWTLTGTAPSGERLEVNGCDFYFFDMEARVVKKDSYWKLRGAHEALDH